MSEGDQIPGKSSTELAVETFVDRIMEIYPNLDQEQLHNTISGCVHEAVSQEDEGEEGGDEEEES